MKTFLHKNRVFKTLILVGFLTLTTMGWGQYCTPTFTYTVEPITLVQFAGINKSTSENTSSPGYEDFSTSDIGNVVAGQTYPITLKGYTGGNYTNRFTVFIDFNGNGTLNDAGEMFEIGSIQNSTGTDLIELTGNITIPVSAPTGSRRMRVVKNFSTSPTDPCGPYSWGQAEDYTINIVSPCSTVDHNGQDWIVTSNITSGGKHINIGNFIVNNGVTITIANGCPFEVEAINIDVRGTINGDGKGHAGGSGGAGGNTYGSCSNDERKFYSGGAGTSGNPGAGTGGGNTGGNGGNATGTSRKCGGWFCSGNEDGHFGGGGGAGGGGGGAYGGSGGSAPWGASGGSFTPDDNSSGTFGASGSAKTAVGTTTGADLVMGSGGAGGGGGGGSTRYAGTAGGTGGRGGGMISLKACNNLSMTGVITANGSNGANGGNGGKNGSENYNQSVNTCGNCGVCGEGTFYAHGGAGGGAGGGSGGGILLEAYGNSTITGILRANGGRGGNAGSPKTSESDFGIDYANGGGGGSGGRIKVFRNPCATNNINPSSISTNGGQGGLNGNGTSGSAGNSGTSSLSINHPDYSPLLAGSIISSNITICSNTTPTATINANVSTGGAKNATLSCASGLPDYEYQWYVTKTACSTPTTGTGSGANTGWVAVSGATGQNMTASQVLAGINQVGSIAEPNMYCFQRRTKSGNCYAWTGINSITVNPSPTPTFVSVFPSNNICVGTNITYTTQSGMSDYTWSIPGNAGVDYTIVSGGTSTDDNIVIAWNNASANTVIDVSYEQNGCAAVSPTSSTPITLPNTGNNLSGNESATCYVNGTNPIHFYNPTAPHNYIGSINPQGREGLVTMTSYLNVGGIMDACDMPGNPNYQTAYMERSFTVNGTITGGSNLSVYFPFTDAELNNLMPLSINATPINSSDDVLSINDLVMTQYSGGSIENGNPLDNCIDGSSTVIPLSARGDLSSAFTLSPNITAKYGRVDIASFSEFYFHGLNANSPLPVELSHFSASCDEHVEILWVTESELNADKFIVEKSRNGVNWELVDELVAAGNSNSHLSYSTTDKKPYQGVSYYRLRQVDFDGKEKIYGPISVSCTYDGNSINVYPNPNNGNFTVEINSPSDIEEASLQLLDVTGKLIASREFQIVDGVTQIMIEETQSLKPGTYVLKVIADVYFEPVKIVVK